MQRRSLFKRFLMERSLISRGIVFIFILVFRSTTKRLCELVKITQAAGQHIEKYGGALYNFLVNRSLINIWVNTLSITYSIIH